METDIFEANKIVRLPPPFNLVHPPLLPLV